MSVFVKLRTNHRELHYRIIAFCVFVAFFNAVLRFSPESHLSLYRLLMPVQLFMIFIWSKAYLNKMVFFSLALCVTNIFSLYLGGYGFDSSIVLVFTIHYLTITMFFLTVDVVYQKGLSHEFVSFLRYCSLLFVVLGGVTWITGINLPNISASPKQYGVIRSFMVNENDTSLVYGTVIVLYLYILNVKVFEKAVVIFMSFLYIFMSDSKMVMLTLVSVFMFYIFSKIKIKGGQAYSYCLVSFLLLLFILVGYANLEGITLSGYKITDLVLEPIKRILTLDAYNIGYGSLYVRTDMTIYALLDVINSYGLGIGMGNTLKMIEIGRYGQILEGAKSIHNFPLQLVTEIGIPMFFFIMWYITRGVRLKYIGVFFLLLLMSLSQSVGVFSNYFFIVVMFTVLQEGKKGLNLPLFRHNLK
ncbi:conserved membrane hypothetical protein [Vibrio chagasii]|nr:conserved membrane hypothetical protein [Vibrio chagasii]